MIERTVRNDFYDGTSPLESVRKGFGRGLIVAGYADDRVVALSADLTESVGMDEFEREFGPRFVQVGVAEQNLVTVASGLAHAGKIPFAASYAAFNPGRNWEQIRTTICLNDVPVKIVGSHAGLTVGPDGATHQCLEDIALMRSLPNMTVIAPGDSVEAEKATRSIAVSDKPAYLRLVRNKTAVFTQDDDEFEIGKIYRLHAGSDVTIISTGTMTATALRVTEVLKQQGIGVDLLHAPTVKPLDEMALIESVEKTGRIVTIEEGQIAGGLGGAVAEVLAAQLPIPVLRLGVDDQFGESGSAEELLQAFGLDDKSIAKKTKKFVYRVPQYRRGY